MFQNIKTQSASIFCHAAISSLQNGTRICLAKPQPLVRDFIKHKKRKFTKINKRQAKSKRQPKWTKNPSRKDFSNRMQNFCQLVNAKWTQSQNSFLGEKIEGSKLKLQLKILFVAHRWKNWKSQTSQRWNCTRDGIKWDGLMGLRVSRLRVWTNFWSVASQMIFFWGEWSEWLSGTPHIFILPRKQPHAVGFYVFWCCQAIKNFVPMPLIDIFVLYLPVFTCDIYANFICNPWHGDVNAKWGMRIWMCVAFMSFCSRLLTWHRHTYVHRSTGSPV